MGNAKTVMMAIVIASLFLNISCSNTKVKELEHQLLQKDNDYLNLKNDFKKTQESNDKQYDELISIQSELAKLDSLSHLYRGTIIRRESKSLTMKEEIDSLISKIKDDIQKKDVEIQNHSKTENKLRVVIKSLTDQLNVKEQEINELKGIVSSQRGQISNLGGQLERLEGRERELSQQIIELESKKRELEDNMRLIQGEAYYNLTLRNKCVKLAG